MRLLFTKQSKPASYAIRFLTDSPWSHVAAQLKDGSIVDTTLSHGGVRRWSVDDWARIYKEVETREFILPGEHKAEQWALEQLGKPYDWLGVIGLGLRKRKWHDETKWFCSEMKAAMAMQGGRMLVRLDAKRVTPRDLWVAV